MGDIILCICLIGLGIYNLMAWKSIKKNLVITKAILINRFVLPRRRLRSLPKNKIATIKYQINDREYTTKITVNKKSPLYDGEEGKEYDVYVSSKNPKLVVATIYNDKVIICVSGLLFLWGLLIIVP